jgi:pimeloyl-ACP methyl ester carboxylesterase
MKTVQSRDGTTIAFMRSGSGPSLILIVGALSDHTAAAAFLPHLASHFTVYTYDRRGRGQSGNTQPYAVEREVEDIVALVDDIGEPVFLFGHSAGAILALEAALGGQPVQRLVLYEPPFTIDGQRPWLAPDLAGRLQELLVANDREAAVRLFLREGGGLPEEVLDQIHATPQWAAWLALAHTTLYDAEIGGQCLLSERRLSALQTPTLVLQGEVSPAWMRASTQALTKALPHGQLAILPGQDHFAMLEAPKLLAGELISFLVASQ